MTALIKGINNILILLYIKCNICVIIYFGPNCAVNSNSQERLTQGRQLWGGGCIPPGYIYIYTNLGMNTIMCRHIFILELCTEICKPVKPTLWLVILLYSFRNARNSSIPIIFILISIHLNVKKITDISFPRFDFRVVR